MRRLLILTMTLLLTGGASASTASIGGPFELSDQDGHAVTQASFGGRPLLLYFGYTSCPDVCPVDLAKVERIAAAVRHQTGRDITPVFVTVDPERDTPARLKAYVRAFGPDVIGLTGTAAQVKAVTDAYHVYFKRIPVDGGGYMVDHSTLLFLVGPQGTYLDHYGRKVLPEDVVARVVNTLSSAKEVP